MQLETVALPAPPTAPTNPHSMPLPKVTVSTSSGERLQPPPRVATADSGAGPTSQAELASQVEEIPDAERADEECKESGMVRSVQHAAPDMLVGSVQLSEDGAAMLFSTG